jgi:rfaE bifunctional protein nucleotidyltransferase chain/domain
MKIGWTNGTFRVIHWGHYKLFEYAKSMCDYLIVGIDSDKGVIERKGDLIHTEDQRKEMLLGLRNVDEVIIFRSPNDLEEIIKTIKPDIMVIGDDYNEQNTIGGKYAKQLIFFQKIEGFSTTKILDTWK